MHRIRQLSLDWQRLAFEEFRKVEGRAGAPRRNEYKSGFGRVIENTRQELVSFSQS